MIILAGLGNPGEKYARNRHNVGFMALDEIARTQGFGAWKSRFQGQIAEGRLGTEKVLLLKPMTMMNLSGQSVGEAMRFFKLEPEDITVFHDEIDLVPGKCRVKRGGGHAGHNGLRSLHQHIGPDYTRVRIGVGHPGRKEAVPGYVLHDFARADQDWLQPLLTGIGEGSVHLGTGNTDKFMNAVSLHTAPPKKSPNQPAPKTSQPPPAPEPEPEPRSKFQQLLDKFARS